MQTKILRFICLLAVCLAGLTACEKAPSAESPADTYRSLLIGSWLVHQHGIDLDGDGKGEETEISALPPSLFSLIDFYPDATGMVYIQGSASGKVLDSALHFTWNVPGNETRIHFLFDGQETVFAEILKLDKIRLVMEYENRSGVKEWLYLTKP